MRCSIDASFASAGGAVSSPTAASLSFRSARNGRRAFNTTLVRTALNPYFDAVISYAPAARFWTRYSPVASEVVLCVWSLDKFLIVSWTSVTAAPDGSCTAPTMPLVAGDCAEACCAHSKPASAKTAQNAPTRVEASTL